MPPGLTPASLALAGALALSLAALIVAISAHRRQRRLLHTLRSAAGDPDFRAALDRLLAGLAPIDARLARVESEAAALTAQEPDRLQPPGVVHFQAYGNEGPALSFSLALINRRKDGIVVTSLYGRDVVRLFAKPLAAGRSESDLAAEEQQAILLAASGGGHRVIAEPGAAGLVQRRGKSQP